MAVFDLLPHCKDIVLTNKAFHPPVARIEIMRTVKIFRDLHSRSAVAGKQTTETLRRRLIGFCVPRHWSQHGGTYLVQLGECLNEVLGCSVEWQYWALASDVIRTVKKLQHDIEDSLSERVLKWVNANMSFKNRGKLAEAVYVLHLLDGDADVSRLTEWIRDEVYQANRKVSLLLILQDVSYTTSLDSVIEQCSDTLCKHSEHGKRYRLERQLEVLEHLPNSTLR